MRSSVDLPHPDGPTSTMNSPSAMSKPMPWITLVLPKDFSIFANETDAINLPPFVSPGRPKARNCALPRGAANESERGGSPFSFSPRRR